MSGELLRIGVTHRIRKMESMGSERREGIRYGGRQAGRRRSGRGICWGATLGQIEEVEIDQIPRPAFFSEEGMRAELEEA